MKVCSYFNGGDCVTIEQYVFCTLCGMRLQNYTKFFDFDALNCENHIKCDRFCIFLWQIDTKSRNIRY